MTAVRRLHITTPTHIEPNPRPPTLVRQETILYIRKDPYASIAAMVGLASSTQ